jgi:hypothetical protein
MDIAWIACRLGLQRDWRVSGFMIEFGFSRCSDSNDRAYFVAVGRNNLAMLHKDDNRGFQGPSKGVKCTISRTTHQCPHHCEMGPVWLSPHQGLWKALIEVACSDT